MSAQIPSNYFTQPFNISNESQSVQRILKEFQINLCDQKEEICTQKTLDNMCHKAHDHAKLRRYPFTQNQTLRYVPSICPYIQKQSQSKNEFNFEKEGPDNSPKIYKDSHKHNQQQACPQKDNCCYCHTQSELEFHPLYYKTMLCKEQQQTQNCSKSNTICPFAHSENELRYSSSKNLKQIQNQNPKNLDDDLIQHNLLVNLRKGSEGPPQMYQIQPSAKQYQSPQSNAKQRKNTQGNISNQKNKKFSLNQNCNESFSSQNNEIQNQVHQLTGRVVPYHQPTLKDQIHRQNSYYGTQNVKMSQCIPFLDLTLFKTQPCSNEPQNHNLKKCPYYHDYKKDRRRPLGHYQSEKCWYIDNHQECPFQDSCDKAHNRVEEFYHPDKYKAKFCSSYLKGIQECEYGDFCSFAHSQNDLSVELIEKFEPDMDFYLFHFKTVWCPYREDDHERDVCVYAHNWQDYRRKPAIFSYSKEMCSNWHTKDFITSYKDGCQFEYKCPFSHGWKEQEFHPDFFKVKPCLHGDSCEKPHCPYFHSETDRKYPLTSWFRYYPKTRTVNFPTNFYVPILSKLSVVHKQTSFSKMSTELACNFYQVQTSQMNQQIADPKMMSWQQPFANNQIQVNMFSQSPQQIHQFQRSVSNISPQTSYFSPNNNIGMTDQQKMNYMNSQVYSQMQPQMISQQVQQQRVSPFPNNVQSKVTSQTQLPKFPQQNYRKSSEGNFYKSGQSLLLGNNASQNQQQSMQQLMGSIPFNPTNQTQQYQSPQPQGQFKSPNKNAQWNTSLGYDQQTTLSNTEPNQDEFMKKLQLGSQSSAISTPTHAPKQDTTAYMRKFSCQSADPSFQNYFNQYDNHPQQTNFTLNVAGPVSKQSSHSNSPDNRREQNGMKWQSGIMTGQFQNLKVEERENDCSSDDLSQCSKESNGDSKKQDKQKSRVTKKQKILEIIDDDSHEDRLRNSSQEITVSKDIEQFLNNRGLEFLLDCFTDKHKLNLKILKDMNEEQLEEVLEGKLYVKRMKDELNKLKLD